MSGAPFDKKKEDAGVPFEMGGELPDFLTVIPTEESTSEVDNAAPAGEFPPFMPDFTMADESFDGFGEAADEMPDFSTFGEVEEEPDMVPDVSVPDMSPPDLSPPDFSPDFPSDAVPDISFDTPSDISNTGESPVSSPPFGSEQSEPPSSLFSQTKPPEIAPDSPFEIASPFSDFEAETPSLVIPGSESMKVYTPEGIHMPEHEISIPAPQSSPPVPEAPSTEVMPESTFSAPPLPVFEAIPEPVSAPPSQPVVSPFPPSESPAPQSFPPMSVPSEQQLPVNQEPLSVDPSSSEDKKDIMSWIQWVLRSFVATGSLKTRITSFSNETAPSQATPSAPETLPSSSPLSPSQAISPQTFPSQSLQPLSEIATLQPEGSVKQISGHIQEIDSAIESLSSVVSSMDTRLGEVSATALPDVQLPDIEKMVTGILSEKLSSMDAFTSNVAGEVSALKESVGSLKSAMESNASTLVEVLNTQSTITDIQTAISEKVDELGSRTEINMEDIADTSAQVKAASEALESLTATVSVLLDEVSSTLSTTTGMEEIIRRLQADKASVDELSGFIESVHLQIQELEASISDAQEESKGVENMVSIDTQIHAPLVKLTQIKNEQPFVKLCMEWLEFLLELVGKNNMPEILDYYVGVGWISDDARLELMLMARGMDNYTEKDEWKLHPDDHLKSLWFIEQLCGIKVDRFTMQQIDRDISKMKDGLETLYNI